MEGRIEWYADIDFGTVWVISGREGEYASAVSRTTYVRPRRKVEREEDEGHRRRVKSCSVWMLPSSNCGNSDLAFP